VKAKKVMSQQTTMRVNQRKTVKVEKAMSRGNPQATNAAIKNRPPAQQCHQCRKNGDAQQETKTFSQWTKLSEGDQSGYHNDSEIHRSY
jgi:hypothetical protein